MSNNLPTQNNTAVVDRILSNKYEIARYADGHVSVPELIGMVEDLRESGCDVNEKMLGGMIYIMSFYKLTNGPFIVDMINKFGFDQLNFAIRYIYETSLTVDTNTDEDDSIQEVINKVTTLYAAIHNMCGDSVADVVIFNSILNSIELDEEKVFYKMADYEIEDYIDDLNQIYKSSCRSLTTPVNFLLNFKLSKEDLLNLDEEEVEV